MDRRTTVARMAGAGLAMLFLLPMLAAIAARLPGLDNGTSLLVGALVWMALIPGVGVVFALPRLQPRLFALTGGTAGITMALWTAYRFYARDNDEYEGAQATEGALMIFVAMCLVAAITVLAGIGLLRLVRALRAHHTDERLQRTSA